MKKVLKFTVEDGGLHQVLAQWVDDHPQVLPRA